MYSRLESLLINAANKQDYEEDLDFVTKFYGIDLCKEQFKMQLDHPGNQSSSRDEQV